MTTLLALDPGETTGWSLWRYDAITPPRPLEHGQISGGLEGFIMWWRANEGNLFGIDEVVSESFRLGATARTGGSSFGLNTTPLKIEGALAVLWPDVIYQPNTMKMHMPDEKIKDLGLWWPGEGHATDSLRHAWAYLKMRLHAPTLAAAWPDQIRLTRKGVLDVASF